MCFCTLIFNGGSQGEGGRKQGRAKPKPRLPATLAQLRLLAAQSPRSMQHPNPCFYRTQKTTCVEPTTTTPIPHAQIHTPHEPNPAPAHHQEVWNSREQSSDRAPRTENKSGHATGLFLELFIFTRPHSAFRIPYLRKINPALFLLIKLPREEAKATKKASKSNRHPASASTRLPVASFFSLTSDMRAVPLYSRGNTLRPPRG